MALWQVVCAGLAVLLAILFVLIALMDPDAVPERLRRSPQQGQ